MDLAPHFPAAMPRYYFDVREGDDVISDDEGLELSGIEAAWVEAVHSLADILRDGVRARGQGADHRIAIEVRDGTGPVLAVKVTFEAEWHAIAP
ncbi:hypothetical protein [Bradyrhizobium sp. 157]|uniref:DUF6894 family protein n=1 Tax=Bradyrhizobium sp. 157 TaxID=2782631 RepID=UPI001FF827C6|nr:hypothetical protein [Bradyrhizobium sp. 157]